jgi:hypothetical protein
VSDVSKDASFHLEEALTLLQATPAVLDSLLRGLPSGWLDYQEEPEAWSPHTVLVHFVHNEVENWTPRLRVLLSDRAVRVFPPFQQLPDGDELKRAGVAELLRRFSQLRQESVSFVRGLGLGPNEFQREGEHPVLGTVNLENLLATWVVHDLNHLHQIAKSLAKLHEQSVGPWRKYLAILDL